MATAGQEYNIRQDLFGREPLAPSAPATFNHLPLVAPYPLPARTLIQTLSYLSACAMAKNRGRQRPGRKKRRVDQAHPDDDANESIAQPPSPPPRGDTASKDASTAKTASREALSDEAVVLDDAAAHGLVPSEAASEASFDDTDSNDPAQDAPEVQCCFIYQCFDLLLEAGNVDEDLNELWQSAESCGIIRSEHSIKEATMLLGLHLAGFTVKDKLHAMLYDKLLSPLRNALANKKATVRDKKIGFLTEANIGFAKGKKRDTFIYRNFVFPANALVVDVLMTAFFLVCNTPALRLAPRHGSKLTIKQSALGRLRHVSKVVLDKSVTAQAPGAPTQLAHAPPPPAPASSTQPEGPASDQRGLKTQAPATLATTPPARAQAPPPKAGQSSRAKGRTSLTRQEIGGMLLQVEAPRRARHGKRRRSEEASDDYEESDGSTRFIDAAAAPLTVTQTLSPPSSAQRPTEPKASSPPTEGAAPTANPKALTLETLIASPIARITAFCKDHDIDVCNVASSATIYAKAIMLSTGATELIGVDSPLESALREAMPPTG